MVLYRLKSGLGYRQLRKEFKVSKASIHRWFKKGVALIGFCLKTIEFENIMGMLLKFQIVINKNIISIIHHFLNFYICCMFNEGCHITPKSDDLSLLEIFF